MIAASLACADHPLATAFWRFNVAIAELVHPTRRPALLPQAWQRWSAGQGSQMREPALDDQAQRSVHRHWSAGLLRDMRLSAVTTFDDPRLPLAMAEQALFDRLLVSAGATLLGPSIRRLILRTEVAAVEAQLGPEVMQFLRRDALRLWPGTDDESPSALPPDAAAAASRQGAALLATAFKGAPAAIGRRAILRLPAEAVLAGPELPPRLSDPSAALQLSRSTLQVLAPQWLSLFPAPR